MKTFHVSFIRKLLLFFVSGFFLWVVPEVSFAGAKNHLPEGPGRDLVVNTCTVCHSDSIIRANRMSRSEWDRTITWMQKQQGLWGLDKKTRKGILDYLETHFGSGVSGNSNRHAPNPMYRHNYHSNPL